MKPAVSDAVIGAISAVLRDTGRDTKSLEPAMLLAADIGLDSLDLAQTIVLLERSLGVDPFRTPSTSRPSVRTVSDLISIYTQALSHS
ncbi:MAG: acyl carrier protein [Planctomycetota bacterium]